MPDLGDARIGQIAIRAKDLERATAFYRDTLGFRFLFSIPNGSFFDCGGVRLFVDLPEGERFDHEASIVYFKVDDIHGTMATLRERGVRIMQDAHLLATMPDHELWMGFFEDSEDNVLAVMAELPLPGYGQR